MSRPDLCTTHGKGKMWLLLSLTATKQRLHACIRRISDEQNNFTDTLFFRPLSPPKSFHETVTYELRAVSILFMTLYALLIISVHKTLNFMHFLQKRDIRTDQRTDRPTDRRTDTFSYRDARII